MTARDAEVEITGGYVEMAGVDKKFKLEQVWFESMQRLLEESSKKKDLLGDAFKQVVREVFVDLEVL